MTRVVEKVRIAKAADALWQEIGSFGAVGRWYPMLSRVETTGELPPHGGRPRRQPAD